MRRRDVVADLSSAIEGFFSALAQNPAYLILFAGGIAFLMIFILARHIHKIRSEDIFIHQAWGANWKGR